MNNLLEKIHGETIGGHDFRRIGKLIEESSGIKMPLHKKAMLQSRLRKRMVQLQITSFKQYVDFVLDDKNRNTELIHLLNVVSTNKTEFFREPVHFSILRRQVIPELVQQKKEIKIWSAGCSSGEEIYSLAMIMEEAQRYAAFRYHITGTDISEPVLQKAARAVYPEAAVENIPLDLRKRYLLRNKDKSRKLVRICQALRQQVRISYLNFMDEKYELPADFDVVFFRNVLIYYNKETQKRVLENICRHIRKQGYLFIGLSENLMDISLPLQRVGSNVYQKVNKPS